MSFLNTLNRIVIVIACLVLLVALTALFILPHIALTELGRWMVEWGSYFEGQNTWTRLAVGIGLAVVVDILLLVVIFIEVRRGRRRYIRVQQVSGGMATINIDSVTELLQHRLDPLPGVISITPTIRAKGNKVDAHVDVGVGRGTNVPQTASLLISEIQSILTDELGMQIAGVPSVRVNVVVPRGEETSAPESAPVASPPALPPALPPAEAPAEEQDVHELPDREIDAA